MVQQTGQGDQGPYQQRLVVAAGHDDEGGDCEGESADGQSLLSAEPVDEEDGHHRPRKLGERRPDQRHVVGFLKTSRRGRNILQFESDFHAKRVYQYLLQNKYQNATKICKGIRVSLQFYEYNNGASHFIEIQFLNQMRAMLSICFEKK